MTPKINKFKKNELEEKQDDLKFHQHINELICNWSLVTSHHFTEKELKSLVDILGDDFKNQVIKIHAHGVHVGKELNNIKLNKLKTKYKEANDYSSALLQSNLKLKEQLDKAIKALQKIYDKSQDNLAASIASTILHGPKFAILSENLDE